MNLEPAVEVVAPRAATASDSLNSTLWSHGKELIELLAKLLPGLALIIAIVLFRSDISDFLRSASKVEAFGIKLERQEFAKRLQASADKLGVQKDGQAWTDIPFRKLRLAAPFLKGAKILWVDDHPENNFFLRRILTDVDVDVIVATTNQEGLDAIKRKDFFLVISDFGRDPPLHENGGELAKEAELLGYEAPFLFYTARPEAVSASVPHQTATNDPAVLLSTIAELAFVRNH